MYAIDALYRKESRLIFQPKSSKTVLVWLSLSLPGQHSAIYTAVVQGHIKSIQRIELTPGTALMQSNQTTTTARQSAVVTQCQSTGSSSQSCPGLGSTPGDCQPFTFLYFCLMTWIHFFPAWGKMLWARQEWHHNTLHNPYIFSIFQTFIWFNLRVPTASNKISVYTFSMFTSNCKSAKLYGQVCKSHSSY